MQETAVLAELERFADKCAFENGALVLDLDGTALLEREGQVFISSSVEQGVKAVHDLGRPVVLNTLRFPLSVIKSVGEAWYEIADVPILTVLLNGSVIGYIKRNSGLLEYEELMAFPLQESEIDKILHGITELFGAGIHDLLLFFYTRNWQEGETLWTPNVERLPELQQKFLSASRIFSATLDELKAELLTREVCMACLFIDRPEDRLMAYQHSKRNNFFTSAGVDKASGVRAVATKLGFSLVDSVGAGDTEMDSFLNEVGLAVMVGRSELPFRGKVDTVRVPGPQELGDLILRFVHKVARPA
jgi:hydroxymethylpyrimidine pyrophosphatase-like HAD family hydrolase